MADRYDLIVIGAGPGGYVASIRAGQLGLKTLCVEKDDRLGGTCLLRGCIPTKQMLETAELYDKAREAEKWGFTASNVAMDMAAMHRRKDKVVSQLTRGIEFLYKKNGVEWARGAATIAGEGTVEIAGKDGARTVQARAVIVATGSAPRTLPTLPPIDGKRMVTSDELLGYPEVPKRMVVLGAGAVGVEFASAFHRYGSEVTLVEAAPHLLPVEDEDISGELEKSFRKQKIKFHVSAKLEKANINNNVVKMQIATQKGGVELEAELLLVAVGRRPVTEGLGLEKTRAKVEQGFLLVDRDLRSAEPWLYGIGDAVRVEGVSSHPLLAHLASAEGIFLVEKLAGRNPPAIRYDQVPGATYCEPEVASVGLTEKAARARGYEVKIGVFPFAGNSKALILGNQDGMVKIVADARYDEVLGVHICGPRATEMIAEACSMLRLEATSEELVRTIHAHPTLSEAMVEAAHAVHEKPIHI